MIRTNKNDFESQICANMKKLCKGRNISIEELSKMAGFAGRDTLERIEDGGFDLKLSEIRVIADVLGVSTKDLLDAE